MSKLTKPGFTLIEILVVVVILGVLASLIMTNLVGGRDRSSDSAKKRNLNQLKIALRLYYNDFGKYPPMGNGLSFPACGDTGTTNCSSSFIAGGKEYMSKLPTNKGGQYEFRYYPCNDQDDFRLKINLTNASDPDILESQAQCPATTCLGQTLAFGPTDYVVCGN